MSVYENTVRRPVPLGAVGIFSVVTGLEQAVGRARSWQQRRRTRSALNRLSDTQLADIGLTRGAIADL